MRRYREDSQRVIRLQSGTYVRRPMAEPVRESYWRDAAQALAGFAVLLLCFGSVYLWMAIAAASQVKP